MGLGLPSAGVYFRAMRSFFHLLFSIPVLTTAAQTGTVRLTPGWIFGDVRQVTTVTTTVVNIGDSITETSTATTTARISVPDLRKDYYVLAVRTDATDGLVGDMSAAVAELPEVFRDSVLRRMREVVTSMYEPLAKRETRFKVGRDGKLIENLGFGEEADPRPVILEAVKQLQVLTREDKRRTAQQLAASRELMTDSLLEAFERLQLATLQEVLDPYLPSFPVSGSVRQPVTMRDIHLPALPELHGLAGIQDLGLDELTEKTLVARVVQTGSSDELLKLVMAQAPQSTLKKQDLSVVEERVHTIDRVSGWPQRTTAETRVRIGGTRVRRSVTTDHTIVKP